MKGLNQEQHIQLLQFMSLMQTCKTEAEMKELQEQYYNIPRYEFLQEYISEKNAKQSFSSYKTNLIYDMDKYHQDYKFVYGENFPAYRKETMKNNKADYTVLNLLNEISECDDVETYQKLVKEKNNFPKAKIESLSPNSTGIFFYENSGLPGAIIPSESKFNARKQLVEAGFSPFDLPSIEDVKENGIDWLYEEISHFKETLNPNFIEMENQMNQEAELNKNEYEEEFDDFIEQMYANGGMSAMAAEADYNASLDEYEDIDEAQRQMDIDNGLIDENGNEILYDAPENEPEKQKSIKAIDVWTEVNELISNDPEYEAKKFATLNYLYDKGTDDAAGYENSFERNILRLEEISKSDKHIEQIFEKYKDYKIDFDDQALSVKIAGRRNNNFDKAKQDLIDFVENKKYLRESELTQEQEVSLFDKELQEFIDGKLPKNHIFTLGKPSEILVKCGFPVEQRIELSASHLEFKSKLGWHPFDIKDVMGLEEALQKPIAVFEYGNRTKSQNIIVNIEKDGKNFLAGVHFNQSTRGYEVSDIRTLFPKDNIDWLRWIEQGKMIYGNKEKLQALIAQQRINVAEVSSQVAQSPLYEHCLESSSSILDKFGKVKDIFTDEYLFYEEVKKKAAIEQKFFNFYVTKGNLDARELSVFESDEFYNALISGDTAKIDEYTKTDLHEINELAAEIYESYSKENEVEMSQNFSDNLQESLLITDTNITDSMKLEENIYNDIIVENSETESQYSSFYAHRPKNAQDLHQFFIDNPYNPGIPVPTIVMRNEQTGHSTFIEGYEFARFEDIGKQNPAFSKEDKNGNLVRIKPDGQTVVLTKPDFKEEINEETGKKELVPDESKRRFIKISRDLYEQAIKNSEIIAKRQPKNELERQKMIDDYLEAANLDEKRQRNNTASNFWHNYQAGVMTLANNKQEAMDFAKRLVNEMIPSERERFATMVRNYEKIKGSDGKHLSYDRRILDFYDNMGLKITNKSIWRDHVERKYDTLDAIKQNTEVFDKEGQPLDKNCRMKIGDTIKMSVTVDSAFSKKKIKLPSQEYRLVAHSKDNNSVALISADGKQKIIKNREYFIKEVQKVEKKQIKKQQRQDRYESISM